MERMFRNSALIISFSCLAVTSFSQMLGGLMIPSLESQYPTGSVFCASGPTAIVEVTNPTTGKTWMDRNLGASQVATSSTDAAAYGDLYQWGRRSDGHQCRNSATTTTLSSTDTPANGSFILTSTSPFDWRSPQNTNLWQGVNGVNNPCPSGYRIPTETELNNERLSWGTNNSAGAFSSPLKLTRTGDRLGSNGSLSLVGTIGRYSSSTVSSADSRRLGFDVSSASMATSARAGGYAIRCIKDTPATLGALNCSSATTTGTLIAGQAASGVSTSVPYTGGNGGSYSAQSISSTGVTGLTATLADGSVNTGSGALVYTITGTPATAGTANFAISLGGQSCTFTVTVTSLVSQYPAGSVFCASGPTAIVEVTNPTTGRTWMDRNLGASQVATSSTDAAAYGDLYQWGRRSDGHQCRNSATTTTLSSTDTPAHGDFILAPSAPNDWRSPQNVNLWQGVNGVNNPCPIGYRLPTEPELNAEYISWSSNNAAGAFASPLKLPLAGNRSLNNNSLLNVGTRGYYWSSAVSSANSFSLNFDISTSVGLVASNRAHGYSVRCIKDTPASLGALDCGNAITTGTLIAGQAASGVSTSVPYTGGNGGSYSAQSISSTGVTGLTATLAAGSVNTGSGSLVYTITGTPATAGTASFAISLGGQSCTFTVTVTSLAAQYPVGSVFCASGPTAIVEVTNPTTGKTWMDRNLGASQVATSSSDAAAYGDLYQWGRRSDGHQCRNSATTTTLSSTDTPAHGDFILAPSAPNDWRSPRNANLWQGVNGVNNPCPSGYRLPTATELNAERLTWNSNNSSSAMTSPLRLPMAGSRSWSTGGLGSSEGIGGVYWSSSVGSWPSSCLYFSSSVNSAAISSNARAYANSVRCIKD